MDVHVDEARRDDEALGVDDRHGGILRRAAVLSAMRPSTTREVADFVAARGGIDDPSAADEKGNREVVRELGIVALPGVETWLRRLRDAEIPCVIASSTHRENITATLEVLGLGKFFSAIVAAEDVKRGKPDPEVFLAAAKRINSDPDSSVVFEDALVGIAAGHAAGMRVVAVATTEPRDRLAHADRVVDRLDELSVGELWVGNSFQK
jgi:HAD superfamily hydrolase (TIGR01509 family)